MAKSTKPILISVIGPTAVGKTTLAIDLAEWIGTEIISADSRQFYKELTIGTAKPSPEELARAPHHFIDSHSIEVSYSAGEFGREATKTIQSLYKNHEAVIVAGGSSLYLKALWEGFDEMPAIDPTVRQQLMDELSTRGLEHLVEELKQKDPKYYDQVDRNNGQRIVRAMEVIRSTGQPFSSFRKEENKEMPYRQLKIGLNLPREILFERINKRMDQMIEAGLFEEAASLYPFRDHNALQTVGYSEIFGFMDGQYDKNEAIRLLKRNSRRYAKRQLTWFNKYEDIHWFEPSRLEEIKRLIEKSLD